MSCCRAESPAKHNTPGALNATPRPCRTDASLRKPRGEVAGHGRDAHTHRRANDNVNTHPKIQTSTESRVAASSADRDTISRKTSGPRGNPEITRSNMRAIYGRGLAPMTSAPSEREVVSSEETRRSTYSLPLRALASLDQQRAHTPQTPRQATSGPGSFRHDPLGRPVETRAELRVARITTRAALV